ncbi:MAG: hypothetical protein QOE44_418 [Solirubrobacteraceae bacterium]|nr:hypothetical protein [Solirubrobacteraceae bacterium]
MRFEARATAGQVTDGFDDDQDAAAAEDGGFAERAGVVGAAVAVMIGLVGCTAPRRMAQNVRTAATMSPLDSMPAEIRPGLR